MTFTYRLILMVAVVLQTPSRLRGEIHVEIDFPGGSGEVIAIDQVKPEIRLRPSTHMDKGWDCWWYVKVTGLTVGQVLELEVSKRPWATPSRPAISTDQKNWSTGPLGVGRGKGLVYRIPIDSPTMWFAWGPPFVASHAEQLVQEASELLTDATAVELCKSRGNLSVPALRVASKEAGKPEVWVQARQHAWESGSSWVCDGFVRWLVSDHPRAIAARSHANFTIVPIMDMDSVAMGAGGKSQQPNDHNRDWGDNPHWPEVATAMKQIQYLDKNKRMALFIDLHNPGAGERNPFFYVTPRDMLAPSALKNLDAFLAAAKLEMGGVLPYKGETRESGPTYDKNWRKISKNWVSFNANENVVAVTLETAWNSPNSNVKGYSEVGRNLGLAVELYLRSKPLDEQQPAAK
jgi:hypothetical protein